MNELNYLSPSRIICAPGALDQSGKLAAELGGRSALIVTDPGISLLEYDLQTIASLSRAGLETHLFNQVEADPPYRVVETAIEAARSANADLVIGLGGGSSMDTAKVVALAVSSNQELDEMVGTDVAQGERLPLILIPTTAGTGSEVTFVAVLSDHAGNKKAIYSPKLLPDVALLDPVLTTRLPRHVTAAPALDAIVHAVEAYTSRTHKNPISDAFAVRALHLLGNNYSTVLREPENFAAREAMLMGSTMAGLAFSNASVAAVHGLSYPLSTRYHIPHGHSNALVMGPVFRFNIPAASQQYAELAGVLFPERRFNSAEEAANTFIDKLDQMLMDSGLETRLSSMSVTEEAISEMARDVTENISRLIATNPRDMSFEDVKSLYQEVY